MYNIYTIYLLYLYITYADLHHTRGTFMNMYIYIYIDILCLNLSISMYERMFPARVGCRRGFVHL